MSHSPSALKQAAASTPAGVSRYFDSHSTELDYAKGAVPAGAPGWTEKNIRSILAATAEKFPECGFAVGTYDSGSEGPTKILCSERVDPAIEMLFVRSKWHAAWLPSDGSKGAIIDLPVGLRGLAPFSEENQEAHFGTHHMLIFAMPGPMKAMLAAWRPADYGPFQELEKGPLSEKARSVASIVRLGTEVTATRTAELSAILDRLRLGFVIVDQNLKLMSANTTAQELIQRGNYLVTANGALQLADPMSEARLRQLIAHIAPLPRQSADATGIIAIRSQGGEDLARCVANVQRDADDSLLGPPLFGLTISTQNQSGMSQPVQLRRLGFTPAEAELVADLMKGLTVTQHANERGIAVATARAHLKRAMMRVGVHRQADLIRHIVGLS